MRHRLSTLSLLVVLPLLALWLLFTTQPVPTVRASTIVYVNQAVVGGNNNGTSWADAYGDLQTALAASPPDSDDELWVAAGLYKPTSDTNREATFQLKSGVALYGGFAGIETERDQRDWTVNLTVLSGDIDNNDITTPAGVVTDTANIVGDNSYHVVTGSGVTNTAVLDGFILTAGNANGDYPNYDGGGMYSDGGSPSLTNVTLSGNSATGNGGGGIFNTNNSNPGLTDVTFSNNSAISGGGMYNYTSNPTLTDVTFNGNSGGGMYNYFYSNPSLNNVIFSNNTAIFSGGGMINFDHSNPSLNNVTFSGNTSDDDGGGMYNGYFSSPSLTNVTFNGNSADYDGGGMYNEGGSPILTNVTFNNNSANDRGGGMHNDISSPSLTNVTFSGNNANYNYGGGMSNYNSSPSLTNVTFSGNSAGYGGGMYNSYSSPSSLTNVTFSNNVADYGGGMHNSSSNPNLTNSTFSSNGALDGGGMYSSNSSPSLTNVTFSGNYAASCGGGMNSFFSSPSLTNVTVSNNGTLYGGGGICNLGGTMTVSNSIIANNGGGDCSGPITSAGYNIDSDGSCNLTAVGDMPNTDPLLDPLADNGGYTLTHIPHADSPAIDAGDPLNCPPTDQRGMPRPNDGDGDGNAVCDIGSVEYHPPSLPMSGIAIQGPITGSVQSEYTFTAVVTPISATQPITYVWQTADQTVTHTGGITDTAVFSWNTSGAYVLTVMASNGLGSVTDTHTITLSELPISGLLAANSSPANIDQIVSFTATTTSGTNISYTWDFGDGSVAYGQVVTHVYTLPGDITAVVTASNAVSSVTASTTVTILEPQFLVYLPVVIKP